MPGPVRNPLAFGAESETVSELLERQLEFAPKPTPLEPIGRGRRILGSLGDALSSAGAVRGGFSPRQTGRFAGAVERRQLGFEEQSQEVEAANRDLRNRVRLIGAGEAADERRVKARRAEKLIDEAARDKTAQENNFRSTMVDFIVKNRIPTEGDLLTMSTADLKALVDDFDPAESMKQFMESIPPGHELSSVRKNADGSLSFQTKPKGEGDPDDEIPVSLITALMRGGQDPSAFVKDPKLGAALKANAEVNAKSLLQNKADETFEEFAKASEERSVTFDDDGNQLVDPVNTLMTDVFSQLRLLNAGTAEDKSVQDFYKDAVFDVGDLVEDGTITEGQATQVIVQMRNAIRVAWPDLVLPEVPRKRPTPIPPPGTEKDSISEGVS